MEECRVLANKIRNGELKAEALMLKVLQMAEEAHSQSNCVAQFLSESSVIRARELDFRIEAGEEFPIREYPLLGIPFSVKDMIHVEGADTLGGRSEFMGKPMARDAQVVSILKRSGGIPFCKTNVPQLVWTAETCNPVVGRTTNPANPAFTAGGSSGGEAALIGLGGSLLGVGSDIGGSLRIPAHFSGIYSLKPTSGRIPTGGHLEYFGGQVTIPLVVGPMASSVSNLELFMEAVLGKSPWDLDPSLAPVPFRSLAMERKLRIGVYTNDGHMRASPSCIRALDMCTSYLKELGHQVQVFTPPAVPDAISLYMAVVNADGMASTKRLLSKTDPWEKSCQEYLSLLKLPTLAKKTIAFLLKKIGEKTASRLVAALCPKSVDETWQLQEQIRRYQARFHREWINMANMFGGEMDAIVCPPTALPAHKHDHNLQASPTYSYTMLYNLLDYPAGILPITKVNHKLDIPLTNHFHKKQDNWLQDHAAQLYDPVAMHGLPVAVQVVSRRYNDELVLKIMHLLDSINLKTDQPQ